MFVEYLLVLRPAQAFAAGHHGTGQGYDFVDIEAAAGTGADEAGDFDIAVAMRADVLHDGADFGVVELVAEDFFTHLRERFERRRMGYPDHVAVLRLQALHGKF